MHTFFSTLLLSLISLIFPLQSAHYDDGVTDKEIIIGTTLPMSGPASLYSTIGHTDNAYFEMINQQGAINGRKIRFIIEDDAYNPAKTYELTRKLVESDKVFLVFSSLGTTTNEAVQNYLNEKKIPQLFVITGDARFSNPKEYPWTMTFFLDYSLLAKAFANYVLKNLPNAKIGILYQNDDFGKDSLRSFKTTLGDKALTMIVKEQSFEPTSPTISSQLLNLKNSGADVLVDFSTAKFAIQAITLLDDLNWHPIHILHSVSNSREDLEKAGFAKSQNIISAIFLKNPLDPRWAKDPDVKKYLAFMAKYYPKGNPSFDTNIFAYTNAQLLVEVLKKSGDDLTRENLMKQATHLDLSLPMLLPGIKFHTTPTDYRGLTQLEFVQFKGDHWVPISKIIDIR